MKRLLFFLLLLASCLAPLKAQDKPYEVTRRMPLFYEAMKRQLTYPLAWGTSGHSDFGLWRQAGREVLNDCLQLLPPPPEAWDVEVEATEQRQSIHAPEAKAHTPKANANLPEANASGRYEARRIRFNVSAWSRVPAYLLVPEGKGPFPAILLLHDHGAHFSIGKEKLVRPFGVAENVTQDADEWVRKCYEGSYVGDSLAARGYVVLSVDALYWGERGCDEGPNYDTQQALASNLMQMGSSWPSIIHGDDLRSAELLASLPFVDSERIGCLGFSMGAYRSWMLAALSDVVKASASICWMNTTEHLMTLTNNQNKGGSAYSMLIPGLRRYLDYPHVAALACPKPTLFYNGTRDKLFPVAGVEDAYRHLHAVWDSQGQGDRLITRLWDEKHFFNLDMQHEVFLFFDRWL